MAHYEDEDEDDLRERSDVRDRAPVRPALHASTSEAVTNNVRVEVESQYALEHSQPFQNQWFFHYTVRITNEGDDTVQLLSRHWIITNAAGHTDEVRGSGVVGEQPVLHPGESFQYTSGCPLKTPSGVMRGTYQMVTADGDHFDVEIAPFALHEPYTIH
jgi:ApaG protein